MTTDLLTISEAADLVGLSRQAVWGAVERGVLETVEVDVVEQRIRRKDILAYVERTGGKTGRPKTS